MRNEQLTTDQVLQTFTQELATRGGKITDTFNDGPRLFCRSVLPLADEVRPGDGLHGGIALKATDEHICVYPYTFRLVCRNGAIRAEAVGSIVIEGVQELEPSFILHSIREGIEACAAPEIFKDTITKMKSAAQVELDTALNLLPLLSRHKNLLGTDVFRQIVERFFGEKDKTQFGLANAITSLARDTRDPQQRWNLEELGGGLLIAAPTKLPKNSARAKPRRSTLAPVA
jgi:hypothetical protein